MVRILHAADFHLDSAFTGLNEQQARQRRQESRDLTRRMVEYANDHGVQLMLLAGDLFDSDSIYGQTAEELAAALAEFRGHVVIAPGNHDCYTAASPYARTLWPDNVLIFTAPEMLSMGLSFPQYGCTVYGAAFTAPECPADRVLSGFRAPEDGLIHIGLLHGDVTGSASRYRPLRTADIAASALDYLALGHVHAAALSAAGDVTYGYCGCPEGRGFDELGEKGVYMGEISKGENRLEFLPTARRMCIYEKIDVTGSETNAAAAEKILAVLKEKYGENYAENLFKIELTGIADVNTTEIQGRLGALYFVKLRDKTEPPVNYDELSREISLKGLFVKNMLSRLNAAEREEKENLKEALKLGLKAFDGEVSCDEN